MNTTPREDLHQSVQTIRDTVARLLDDYKYLEHAQSAGDDLVYAIEAFDHQLTNDLELYEKKTHKPVQCMEAAERVLTTMFPCSSLM